MTPKELVDYPRRYLIADEIRRCMLVHFKKRRHGTVSKQEMKEFYEAGHVIILEEKKLGQ